MYEVVSSDKRQTLSIRVNDSDMGLVKAMASVHHRTMSDEMRHMIRETAEKMGVQNGENPV